MACGTMPGMSDELPVSVVRRVADGTWPTPEPDDDGDDVVGCGDECCCSRLRDDVYR